ncbi:MAG: hypothetical protein JNJ88_17915, partial [Planctomycetes bacterium]|nr:hypothetical protein [Planctomycetota bacterium]
GVKYTYDGWGALTKFEQDRNSAVGASGSVDDYEVSYTVAKSYGATSTNPGRRTLQRTAMVLPSGKSITLTYGGTPYFDDVASRVSQVKDGATRLMGYSYNGAGHVVEQISTEASISTRVTSSTAGSYPGLDRFNRIVNCYWQKDLGTPRKFYDVAVTWDKNSNITVIDDAVHTGFDVQYTNDSINRLTKASEGTWSGSSITSKTREQEWTKLSHTGNWDREKLDLNGDGDYTDTDEHDDTRAHNPVNEMTQRSWGGNNYNATYDKNGNLTDDGKDYKYEWDAFNRLVRVKNQSNVLVEEYRYNGLGFRIGWHADSDSDGDVDSNDKWYYPAYDEAWRMVAVFRESDTAPKEEFVPHLAGADGFGGSSLLDGVILRYKDANTAWTSASDGTLEEKRYYAQNWRGDVIAIVSSAGAMYEWVKYSPYGIPFGMPAADTESDGDCDATDITQIQTWINGSAYDVRGDLDLDGDVDTTDKSTAQGSFQGITLGAHVLSNVGSRKGFTGHERATSIQSHWHARHRVLHSALGRWLQRDPLSYFDGVSMYSLFGHSPLAYSDPMGTSAFPAGPGVAASATCPTPESGTSSKPEYDATGTSCCDWADIYGLYEQNVFPSNACFRETPPLTADVELVSAPANAIVICCGGEAKVCVKDGKPSPGEKAKKFKYDCIVEHELTHLKNHSKGCKPDCCLYRPTLKNSISKERAEAEAYEAQCRCLKKALSACSIDPGCSLEINIIKDSIKKTSQNLKKYSGGTKKCD